MIEAITAFIIAFALSIYVALREHGKRKQIEAELSAREIELQGFIEVEKRLQVIDSENRESLEAAEQGIKDGKMDYFNRADW